MRTYEENKEPKEEKNRIFQVFVIASAVIAAVVSVVSLLGIFEIFPVKSYKIRVIIVLLIWIVVFMGGVILNASNFSFKKPFLKVSSWIAAFFVLFLLILLIPSKFTDPISAQLVYVSSRCFGLFGADKHAVVSVEEAISLNPKQASYQAEAGRLYDKQGDYQLSKEYYDKAIELNPNSDYLHFKRGRAYMEMDEPFSAYNDFAIIIKNQPDHEEYNYWFAKMYLERGYVSGNIENYKNAIKYFSKAIEANTNSDEYYKRRAYAYIELGGSENCLKAIEDLTAAIRINKKDADNYYWRGRMYDYLNSYNDYTNAINDFTSAIEINADVKEYYYWRGLSYYHLASWEENDKKEDDKKEDDKKEDDKKEDDKRKNYQASIENFSAAIEMDQEYAEGYNRRAWSYHKSGYYDEGLADMQEAVRLDDQNPDYHLNLGNFYYNGNNYKKAISEYWRAIEIERSAMCYFNLGDAYYQEGEYEDAIDAYTDAINLDSSNVLYLSRRGLCYSLIQEHDLSKEDLIQIMSLQQHGDEIGY